MGVLITSAATIFGALIAAFGAIEAAKTKIRPGAGGVSCTFISLVASAGAFIGLLIGVYLVQSLSSEKSHTQPPDQQIAEPPVDSSNQLSRCEWLARNFPQSEEVAASDLGLPISRIEFLYEACGITVTALVVNLGTEEELQVYEDGGCIDAPSDAIFNGDHIPNPYASGERAYSGTVRAVVMTYRMWCDELH
jgi:hypothetical protein